MKRLSVSLPDDLADTIEADALAGRRSVSAQIVYDLEEVRRRRVTAPGSDGPRPTPSPRPEEVPPRRREVEPIVKGGRR